jgi:hypothetical protein
MVESETGPVNVPVARITKKLGKEIVAVMATYPNVTTRLSANDHSTIQKLVTDRFGVALTRNTFKSYLYRAKALANNRPNAMP